MNGFFSFRFVSDDGTAMADAATNRENPHNESEIGTDRNRTYRLVQQVQLVRVQCAPQRSWSSGVERQSLNAYKPTCSKSNKDTVQQYNTHNIQPAQHERPDLRLAERDRIR